MVVKINAGYVEPSTGRVAVRIDVFTRSTLNGVASAWLFDAHAADHGDYPWEPVCEIDRSDSFCVWLISNQTRIRLADDVVFVSADDAIMLGVK